jgi:serine/threonine protein kinase
VHRDVKPSNVLVDARGHCYLTDFGPSRSVGDPVRAADAALAGTVGYVAPEQVRGDDVDGRADLYPLTCMLVEMLTGELPFRRTTDVATLFAHLEEDPPSAAALRPELPGAIDEVVARGLAKDPGDRQDSCVALVDDTREALGLSVPAPRRPGRPLTVALIAALVAAVTVVVLLRPWAAEPAAAPDRLARPD